MSTAPEVIQVWGQSQLALLVALCQVGFDQDTLSEGDLELCLPHDENASLTVLGTADGMACVALRVLGAQAKVELLVTHPSRRRQGLARLLLLRAQDWALSRGASVMKIGGQYPVGLFSGVDLRWTAALRLCESMGFQSVGTASDLLCSTLKRSGVVSPTRSLTLRVESEEQLEGVLAFVAHCAPTHLEGMSLAAKAGTVVYAQSLPGLKMSCVAAHSVYRLGVIGPVVCATELASASEGSPLSSDRIEVLAAVLGLIRSDLAVAGLKTAEVLGEYSFADYVEACQAKPGRVSEVFTLDLLKPRED